MNKLLSTLALCLLMIGCGTAPQRSAASRADAPYSLAQPQALPRTLTIPLTQHRGYLFVTGSVNGQRAGTMMLDTGSTLNIIDRGVANRMQLPRVGEGRTRGIAGVEPFDRFGVETLAIHNLDLGVDEAASLSMVKLTRGLGLSPAGLIGSISLLPHPFTIDYAANTLTVYNRQTFVPPPDAERLPLEFYGRLPAVRATLANGGEVLLILDTGAGNAVSLPMAVASWPGILATGASGAGAARGVGGEIATQSGWLKNLGIFGYNLGGVTVTFEPKVAEPRRTDLPVGRVGSQLLQGFRLTFDARYRALYVEFAVPAEGG